MHFPHFEKGLGKCPFLQFGMHALLYACTIVKFGMHALLCACTFLKLCALTPLAGREQADQDVNQMQEQGLEAVTGGVREPVPRKVKNIVKYSK